MKILIFAFLFISSLSFSQDVYTFKSGGRVFENNKRIKTQEIEAYFAHKPEIVNLYKAGRTKKTVGNIFLYGGIGTVVGKFLYEAATPSKTTITQTAYGVSAKTEYSKNTLFYVGGAFVLIAIPIKIGFQKKIKKSILLMNEEMNSQKQSTSLNYETNIIANTNGVGLKLTF